MNSTIWLALAWSRCWKVWDRCSIHARRRMIATMSQLPDNILRRFGGGLVVAGIVIYYMLRKTIG